MGYINGGAPRNSWGPPGPQGTQGPKGAQGTKGDTGAPGTAPDGNFCIKKFLTKIYKWVT